MRLTYEDFSNRAVNEKLSPQEKVGFYKNRNETLIFPDLYDDSTSFQILQRYLQVGCETYLLP